MICTNKTNRMIGVDMKNEIELTPYIEDLTWALENNVRSDEIETELKKLIFDFTLPIEEAKRCVFKKFGGDPKLLGKVVDKTISELTVLENSVNLLCKILYIDQKEIVVNGNQKTIFYGIIGDSTGTAPFTAWHEFNFDKGQVIRVYNAYTRAWRDKIQVNFGDKTHIRPVPAQTLPEIYNLNNGNSKECKINEFHDGLRNIATIIRVLEINTQEVQSNGETIKLFRGTAADETGKCRFAAWADFNLKVNDVVKIKSGYIKSWRGVPELQLNGGTDIEKLQDDILPSFEILNQDRIVSIRELKRSGGSANVAIEGVVLDIRPNSGLIKRCTECKRVLQKDTCMVHGKLTGIFDLRIKCVLDDGSGAILVVLDKEITETLLGLDLEDCIQRAKEFMRFDIIYEDLIKKLLARPIRFTGTVLFDDFGLMMIGSKAEVISPRIKTEAVSLLSELGFEMNINNDKERGLGE